MSKKRDQQTNRLEQAFAEYLEYFAKQDTSLSEESRLKMYEEARKAIEADANAAVPFLSDKFENTSFLQKEAAYDLLIFLGKQVLGAIKSLLEQKGAIAQIWLTSILHFHHDFSYSFVFEVLLSSSSAYIRHLAALATVFQGFASRTNPDLLMESLITALLSEEHIEGSAFYVADSALSCITLVTGEQFTEAQKKGVEFYNFNHYLFDPPIHPFPYTSDRVVALPVQERLSLASKVEAWWQKVRGSFQLKEVVSCFDY